MGPLVPSKDPEEPTTVTHDEIILHRRARLLELADVLGNVGEACRAMGVSRTRFYEWKKLAELYGLDALMPKPRRPPQLPNETPTQRRRRAARGRRRATNAGLPPPGRRARRARPAGLGDDRATDPQRPRPGPAGSAGRSSGPPSPPRPRAWSPKRRRRRRGRSAIGRPDQGPWWPSTAFTSATSRASGRSIN